MNYLYVQCFVLLLLSTPVYVSAVYTTERTEQKTVELFLDSDSKESFTQLDLAKYNIPMPAECALPNVSCKESTKIHMQIMKSWQITTVHPLEDAALTATEFSTLYPNIPDNITITKNSDPNHIKILQRTLYERGLLNTLPTGRYGALTELAVLHLQQIKGLDQCTDKPVVADGKTIAAINTIKTNLADETYTIRTVPPPFNATVLCPKTAKRFRDLVRFVEASKRGTIVQTLTTVPKNTVRTTVDGNTSDKGSINIDGFIKIAQ